MNDKLQGVFYKYHSNWCFWTVVLEKTLESPLDCKEIQPVHLNGNQSWIFIGRTDAEVETPVLWPPHAKRWLIGKDSDAGRDWGQEEKGTTGDEMAGWHHWLVDVSLSELRELVMDRKAWYAAIHEVTKSRTRLSHWTELSVCMLVHVSNPSHPPFPLGPYVCSPHLCVYFCFANKFIYLWLYHSVRTQSCTYFFLITKSIILAPLLVVVV